MVKNFSKTAATKFSLKARAGSITYAVKGIISFLSAEHNAVIHFLGTVAIIAGCIVFPVSISEIIVLTIVTGFVWIAELINTAIEKLVDFITTERYPEIKFIKDVAAAAVLVAAITALITGCLVFIPKF